jgi:hypothetical protein
MGIKSIVSKPLAALTARQQHKWMANAVGVQKKWRESIVGSAAQTQFGQDHHFSEIDSYESFKQAVPISDYEELKPYIELIKDGKNDVLWQGKPLYFAKTSGTTSGVKYIPITNDSIGNHINSAKNALLNYIHETNVL